MAPLGSYRQARSDQNIGNQQEKKNPNSLLLLFVLIIAIEKPDERRNTLFFSRVKQGNHVETVLVLGFLKMEWRDLCM